MIMLKKIPKAVWYLAKGDLPGRTGVSYVNFCVHTEMLYDEKTYLHLLKFSRNFNALTGNRTTLCVTTPLSPCVKKEMKRLGVHEKSVAERLSELKKTSEIGYHGHFYDDTGVDLKEMSAENFDERAVRNQMASEIKWLTACGVTPKIYTAGWWFLNSRIVRMLETFGIEMDSSVRKGKSDFFGGRYLGEDEVPPYGKPFILPPSSNILEIQSIFGPVMPPFFMKAHLSGYLEIDREKDIFFVFPLHDWDITRYGGSINANVSALDKLKGRFEWMDMTGMRNVWLKKEKV